MLDVACLDDGVDVGTLGREIGEQALVVDLDDVPAGVADGTREARQYARLVDDLNAQGDDAAVAHEPAQQDLPEQAGVDVAAADDQADALAGEALAVRQHGGEAGGAGPLRHDLLRLRHHLHRLFQRFLLDQQDIAHEPFDDRLGERARRFHGDALGDRLRPEHRREVADGVMHRGIERRLYADHLDVRLDGLEARIVHAWFRPSTAGNSMIRGGRWCVRGMWTPRSAS
jgi:hypothetical protein